MMFLFGDVNPREDSIGSLFTTMFYPFVRCSDFCSSLSYDLHDHRHLSPALVATKALEHRRAISDIRRGQIFHYRLNRERTTYRNG